MKSYFKKVPYGTVPDRFVRNPELSAEALVLLTYRATFAPPYALHERAVCRSPRSSSRRPGIASDFTRDIYRRALVELGDNRPPVPRKRAKTNPPGDIRLGVLTRRQQIILKGTFGRVVETLDLPAGPRVRVYRHIFELEPRLSIKQIATYIFIRCGTGLGPRVFSREVADRFGWTRQTAAHTITSLIDRGLVQCRKNKKVGGRFAGHGYAALVPPKHGAMFESPSTVSPGDGDHGDIPATGYKQHYLDLDMEIINRVGLDHKRLVIDHVDETILDYCLTETKAVIGIGVGQTLRHTNPIWFADVAEKHGSERLMINSDHVAYVGNDIMAIPKAIREMLRRGIGRADIQKVVFDNANAFYGLKMCV